MIVIHEIFGLSDWVRTVTHDLAEAGYVAIAPDLLSRRGGTEGADNARTLIRDLPPDSITVDLNATADYLRSLDSVRGESIGVMGFCWGGSQTFRYATDNPDLKAAVVCYGGAPDAEAMARIETPILGVYAENDARINAALPDVEEAMAEAGKSYEYEIYPGANHGFLRSRNVPEEADRAWQDILAFLGENLAH
jgi:carboxymethylenebutenolidase